MKHKDEKPTANRDLSMYRYLRAHGWTMDGRWRALALAIKAKLEAVETGITSFEEEFLAHIVLPNGHTVSETAIPAIASAIATEGYYGLGCTNVHARR